MINYIYLSYDDTSVHFYSIYTKDAFFWVFQKGPFPMVPHGRWISW